MKLFKFLRKKSKSENSHFAEFFLHASDAEKMKVFKEVGKQANEEQRELLKKLNFRFDNE